MSTDPLTPHDPAPPPRRAVASYAGYRDAEKAVDYLAESKFPIERVAIVGRDLELVEQVTGRVTALDALARGALVGAATGVLIGWLFALFAWLEPDVAWAWLIFDGLWFGTVVGSLLGLIMYAVTKRERHFDSVSAMRPEHFDVVVEEGYAEDAARMLDGYPLASRVGVPSPSISGSARVGRSRTPAT